MDCAFIGLMSMVLSGCSSGDPNAARLLALEQQVARQSQESQVTRSEVAALRAELSEADRRIQDVKRKADLFCIKPQPGGATVVRPCNEMASAR